MMEQIHCFSAATAPVARNRVHWAIMPTPTTRAKMDAKTMVLS